MKKIKNDEKQKFYWVVDKNKKFSPQGDREEKYVKSHVISKSLYYD